MISLRQAREQDWPSIWAIIEPVFRDGETFPQSPDISEGDARDYWMETPTAIVVAVDADDQIIGTYYIRPNQPTLGAHVCNCGYIVAESARGRGVASRMCEDSQQRALALGFEAMQYNLVVSTNTVAMQLWKKQGFTIVGTLAGAFKHARHGNVDAYIMYKELK